MRLIRTSENSVMMRKAAAAVMVFALMTGLCLRIYAKSYPDVGRGSAAYTAVDYLSDMGVVAGYEDGLFKPESGITRGEAAALVARSLGYTEDYEIKRTPFDDVKSGYWAERFISFCWEKGLIRGVCENLYMPADKLTYAQIVKMLVCAAGDEGDALSASGDRWYDGYISAAQSSGILDGVSISPDEEAPRGDVAILVYNCFQKGLIEREEIETPPDTDDETDTPDDEDNETVSGTPSDEDDKPVSGTPSDEDDKPVSSTVAMADKEEVVKSAAVPDDFTFSEVLEDYTAEVSEDDMDFSDLEEIPEEKKLLIVIDAGHNFSGIDSGAESDEYDLKEQYITYPIAEMLRQKLLYMGFDVIMTRDNFNDNIAGDTTQEVLRNRAGIANAAEADLFVSIHCNAGGGKGFEVYCYKEGTKSSDLAEAVREELSENTPLIDRGVKTAAFVVIGETLMPSILVETAFIDTESDFNYLISIDGMDEISTAIAGGIRNYADTH